MAPVDCLAGPGEPLGQHLINVASCVCERGAPVARKIARVFEVPPELALDLMIFAALMHDVGKADEAYKSPEVGFFPLHEARSTDYTYEVLLKARKEGANLPITNSFREPTLVNVALLTVALHHYSHKSYISHSVGGFRPRCYDYKIAFDWWSPLTDVGCILKKVAQSLDGAENRGIHREVIRTIDRHIPSKLRCATAATLGVLNECDAEVAKRYRK